MAKVGLAYNLIDYSSMHNRPLDCAAELDTPGLAHDGRERTGCHHECHLPLRLQQAHGRLRVDGEVKPRHMAGRVGGTRSGEFRHAEVGRVGHVAGHSHDQQRSIHGR